MKDKERDVIGEIIAEDNAKVIPPSVVEYSIGEFERMQAVIAQRDARIEELERDRAEQWHLRRDAEAERDNKAAVIAELKDQLAALKSRPAGGVVSDWQIEHGEDGVIVVQKPGCGGYVASLDPDNIASSILHALATDVLTARLNSSPVSAGEPLPYWEPCNPGCDPDFNGQRSKECAQLCHQAREALTVSAGGGGERAALSLAANRLDRLVLEVPGGYWRDTAAEWAAEARAELAEIKGEGEAVEIDYPDYHAHGMGCGLEDRGITDRYEAMAYGFQEALDQIAVIIESLGPFYTRPPVVAEAEPVEVVGYACPTQLKALKRDTSASCALWSSARNLNPALANRVQLMDVEQHQRIIAAITAQPASGAVPVQLRPLLERASEHLSNWLELSCCECEGGHICGRNEVSRDLDELRALLAKGWQS